MPEIHPHVAELEAIASSIKALEERRDAIYRRSLEAPPEEKVCEDWVAEMLSDALLLKQIQYPLEIRGIHHENSKMIQDGRSRAGSFVKVRLAAEAAVAGTHLGVYLGDMALGHSVTYDTTVRILHVRAAFHNPAIWVPALNRIVFGAESWWGILKSPEDLKDITDADINNVWYVQALNSLGNAEKKR